MSKLLAFVILLALLVPVNAAAQASAQYSEESKTCGAVSGESADDREHLETFCGLIQNGFPGVEHLVVLSSTFSMVVSNDRAVAMIQAPEVTEEIVERLMGMWKTIVGSPDIEVLILTFLPDDRFVFAKGTSTPSGDEITIVQR